MKISRKFLIALIILLMSFSCKEYVSDIAPKNTFRIKKMIEFDEFGDEERIHSFTYDQDKLILWRTYYKDEKGDLLEIKKVTVSYEDNAISALQLKKVDDEWETHQGCRSTIQNNLICEKLISRYSNPECEDCWEYRYSYLGTKLKECKKYIKNSNGDWDLIRKQVYAYSNKNLSKYEDFVVNNNGELILDFIRNYTIENDVPVAWEGGTLNSGTEWQPAQRMEFIYENDLIFSEQFSVWDAYNKSWQLFGTTSYSYDDHNNLIEEVTSNGNGFRYEYEAGKGNASLIYCEPIESSTPEPIIKSTTASLFNSF